MDPNQFKAASRKQWNQLAAGWHAWVATVSKMLDAPTERMLDLAGVGEGAHVVDVAAGDGEPSIRAARRVGPRGKVVATDLSDALTQYAARAAEQEGLKQLDVRTMDAERLELNTESFDAAISRLGIMALPNPVAALSELSRVLKPEGRACVMVLTTPEKTPYLGWSFQIASEAAGHALSAGPGPFSQGAPGVLEDNFYKAGFEDVRTETHAAELVLKDTEECLRLLRDTAESVHARLSGLDESARQAAWDAIGRKLAELETDGAFRSPCEVLLVSAGNG